MASLRDVLLISCLFSVVFGGRPNRRFDTVSRVRSLEPGELLERSNSSGFAEGGLPDATVEKLQDAVEEVDQLANNLQANQGADANLKTLQGILAAWPKISGLTEELLDPLLPATSISRLGYLKALSDIIPRPSDTELGTWSQRPWNNLVIDSVEGIGDPFKEASTNSLIPFRTYWVTFGESIKAFDDHKSLLVDIEALCIARVGARAIAKALREKSDRHALVTHRLVEAISAVKMKRKSKGGFPSVPLLYKSKADLVKDDPAWEKLLEADTSGFRGVLSAAPVVAWATVPFSEKLEEVEKLRNAAEQKTTGPMLSTKLWTEAVAKFFSDIKADQRERTFVQIGPNKLRLAKALNEYAIAFEPHDDTESELHSAVMANETEGIFPPNTLFAVSKVEQVGRQEVIVALGIEYVIEVVQHTIFVRATYMLPRVSQESDRNAKGSKFMGKPMVLSYMGREAFIRGLNDVISKPFITMYQEFERDYSWKDWRKVEYTLKDTMRYVLGRAIKQENCTPGVRDANNHGKTPNEFLQSINGYIEGRRSSGHTGGVPAEHAYLTLDEVIAIRLYSGPAYEPLNGFLRTLGAVNGDFRLELARSPTTTFAATVGHIIRGIRKLSAVTSPEDVAQPVFRGVRGVLPESFWQLNRVEGNVVATDIAFMSTSKRIQTPLHYMGDGKNVLWQLYVGLQHDDGYHMGADISMLSQFAGEAEILFPPYTMLTIQRRVKTTKDPSDSLTTPQPTLHGDMESSVDNEEDCKYASDLMNSERYQETLEKIKQLQEGTAKRHVMEKCAEHIAGAENKVLQMALDNAIIGQDTEKVEEIMRKMQDRLEANPALQESIERAKKWTEDESTRTITTTDGPEEDESTRTITTTDGPEVRPSVTQTTKKVSTRQHDPLDLPWPTEDEQEVNCDIPECADLQVTVGNKVKDHPSKTYTKIVAIPTFE